MGVDAGGAPSSDRAGSGEQEPLTLADAYARLHNLILEGPPVPDFVHGFLALAAAVVPGARCWVLMLCDGQPTGVAGDDPITQQLAAAQGQHRDGPDLEALRSGRVVEVPDLATDHRWADFRARAAAAGIGNGVSLPLLVEGKGIGAVNFYASARRSLTELEADRARSFAEQAGTALTLLLRQTRTHELDDQLRAALTTRAVIDQALGILMYRGRISARQALEILRYASQTSNRKLSQLAAEVIETSTGHQPQPPRPLSTHD